MNSNINYLEWDSDFFKKNIGFINIDENFNFEIFKQETKQKEYNLIYLFENSSNNFKNNNIFFNFNSDKVCFEKDIYIKHKIDCNIIEYDDNILTSELEQLAYSSGKYSRFKLDTNFDKNDFFRLYKTWILNSINKQIADYVFVIKEYNIIKAMVTLKIINKQEVFGEIGLISVTDDAQGKGYGKALINACENILFINKINKLYVSTQSINTKACSFYFKCGFKEKEKNTIYHYWVK